MEQVSENIYHIVISSHDEVICRTFSDYTAFENRIGIAARKYKCTILAYAVMSTHVHIAVCSTDPHDFIGSLKLSYTKYFNRKYNRQGPICRDSYCKEICGYLRQKIAISYILRNPMHHGVTETPFEYAYSSISGYFADKLQANSPQGIFEANGIPPTKQIFRIRNGKKMEKLPTDTNGRVKLEYTINAGRVEYLYRTARSFLHYMNKWNTEDWEKSQLTENPDSEIVTLGNSEPAHICNMDEMKAYEKGIATIKCTDLELCSYIDNVFLPTHGISSYTSAGSSLKQSLAIELKKQFHASTEQIYRCIGGFQ